MSKFSTQINIEQSKIKTLEDKVEDNKKAILYMNERIANFDKIVYIDKYDLEQFSHYSTMKFGQFFIAVDKRFNWFQKLFYKIFLGIEIEDA